MRMWAYQTFRRDDMLTFVAMVTPEDAAANAECALETPNRSSVHRFRQI